MNFESGPLLLDCVRSLFADDQRGRSPRSSSSTTARATDRSATLRARVPRRRRRRARRQPRVRRRRQPGHRGDDGAVVAVGNPDLVVAPGTAAALRRPARRRARSRRRRPRAAQPRRVAVPVGAGARLDRATPSATRCSVACCPRNRFTRRYRQLDASTGTSPATSTGCRVRCCSCVASALDSVGGWDERYFMYMEDVDLCWRLRRIGWRVAYEPSGRVTARAGREHQRRTRTA